MFLIFYRESVVLIIKRDDHTGKGTILVWLSKIVIQTILFS